MSKIILYLTVKTMATWNSSRRVEGTIHNVHKYIEPVHGFLQAQKKQKQGSIKM